ncbi:MAG: IclR family transcriptional regulator [Bacillota bacterium]
MDFTEGKCLIQSLAKGLSILECFISDLDEYGITELSEKTSLPESTVQRIINTLEFKGYLFQNPLSKKYRLSLKLLNVCSKSKNMNLWIERSKKHMVLLNERCGETVNLAIRDDNNLVYLDKVDSKHLLRPNFVVGEHYPLYCTAIGRCLLSDFAEEKLKCLFPEGLQKMTPSTKDKLEDVIKDLAFIKEKGYTIDDEEFQLGLLCIGVPIKAFGGRVVAALSMSMPKVRVNKGGEKVLIAWTIEAAEEISKEYQQLFENSGRR